MELGQPEPLGGWGARCLRCRCKRLRRGRFGPRGQGGLRADSRRVASFSLSLSPGSLLVVKLGDTYLLTLYIFREPRRRTEPADSYHHTCGNFFVCLTGFGGGAPGSIQASADVDAFGCGKLLDRHRSVHIGPAFFPSRGGPCCLVFVLHYTPHLTLKTLNSAYDITVFAIGV